MSGLIDAGAQPDRRTTAIGLTLSLVLPVLYVVVLGPLWVAPRLDAPTSTLIDLAAFWVLAAGVVLYTRLVEKRPVASIGWAPLPWRGVLAAAGIGVALSLLVPVLTVLVSAVISPSDAGGIVDVASRIPWWLVLLGVLTAGVTEEVLFRGYPLERLHAWTGSRWVSGALALMFFVAVHATGWNLAHVVGVVLPLGAVLTGLYYWKRNVTFVMIVHGFVNLPLVFMAAFT